MTAITVPVGTDEDDVTYQNNMEHPVLYESAFDDEDTQGLVTLSDALECKVTFNANNFPILQMTYPKKGVGAKLIDYDLVIMTDTSNKWTHQKFRIVTIAKDIDNLIITANHIVADLINKPTMCDIALPSCSATDCANYIINHLAGNDHQYYFTSDVSTLSNVNIPAGPASDMFISPDQEGDMATQSIIGLYGGELEFDNRTIRHSRQAGRKSGIVVQYGKNLQTIEDNTDIQNTYTAIYPVIKYTPGQAVATQDNVNWSSWDSDWNSIGSVTYMAGGIVNIYDSPVKGQHVIGQLTAGEHVTLGTLVTDGQLIPNPNNSDSKLQVNTINGSSWYPIRGGGWIDSAWVNFDKDGDYLVNPVTGHVTVNGSGTGKNSWSNRYQLKGKAKVTYKGENGGIRVYYAPDIGSDHYPTGEVIKYGQTISFDWVTTNTKGDTWYRIGDHRWLFGPHLSIDNKKTTIALPTKGEGVISDSAPKYHIGKNGQMIKDKKPKSLPQAKKSQNKYIYYNKNGKKKRKPNPAYKPSNNKKKPAKKPVEQHKHTIDKTMEVNGTIYVHTAGGWVTSSSVHYHKERDKPKTPTEIIKEIAKTKGKVEMFDSPDHLHALNWSIPDGTSIAIDEGYEAKGADGNTYVQVTYAGVTGWIREDFTNTTGAADTELHAPDEDSNDEGAVAEDVKEVIVDIGTVYASNSFKTENDRILRVDLSEYFKHDDQDLSGQQPDGSFVQTAADEDQAREIAENYIKEHKIGEISDNFTVGVLEQTGIIGDATALNLYDYVDVEHEQIGVHQPGEVTGIVYNCLTHRNEQITVGNPPKSWQHLLLQQANDNSESLHKMSESKIKNAVDLTTRVHNILKLEGHQLKEAEAKLGEELGVVGLTLDKHSKDIQGVEETQEQFHQSLVDFNNEMEAGAAVINSGGSSALQFVDANGRQTYDHPVEIRTNVTSDGYLRFNDHGLGYFTPWGGLKAAIRYDGTIDADYIKGGTIDAVTINAMQLSGNLVTSTPGESMEVHIGTASPGPLNPEQGGHAIYVTSYNYNSMLSSGKIAVTNGSSTSYIGPNTGEIGNSEIITKSNIKDYITAHFNAPGKGKQIGDYWKF